jgi:hypothetical protein
MIGQDRKPQHIDAETRRQETKPILQPLFAMVVVIAGKRAVAAQKAPPHAAIDTMEDQTHPHEQAEPLQVSPIEVARKITR